MKTATQSKSHSSVNNALLDELCNRVRDRIDSYIDHLGVDLRRYGRQYRGACPVHGGDNLGGLTLWTDGQNDQCNWQCNTHHCQDSFSKSLLGFTQGVLSHAEFNWTSKSDQKVSGQVAVDMMCKFLGVKFHELKVDPSRVERRKFARTVDILSPSRSGPRVICSREQFLKWHEVPSKYYLKRGFSAEVLKKFDVGTCVKKSSPNHLRTIIPVYDESGKGVIGVLSRSQHERCPRCKDCHAKSRSCVDKGEARPRMDSRWVVDPDGFNDKHHLYNLWRAKPIVRRSKCVVIVEGAGDVWRLDEAGIYNAVGLMGSKLGDLQDILLEECTPAHVVIMTDDDDAGNSAAESISRKWKRLAHVHRVKPVGCLEVSEMSADDVRRNFKALIENWMRR